MEKALNDLLEKIKKMLIEKNKKYDNAFLKLEEIGKFYFHSGKDFLKVAFVIRISEKLLRYSNCENDSEDQLLDIIGYCLLMLLHDRKIL
jgi:hypothetical protein